MPIAAVTDSPTTRQTKTARMMRAQRSAIHRMNSTTAIVTEALRTAFSLIVANSSSAIGTGPVSRSRAWYLPAKLRSAAALRMASLARCPGSRSE